MDLKKPPAIHRRINSEKKQRDYSTLRQDAREFPMMIVISTVYPCNFGCPNCPYSEDNSNLRDTYSKSGGDYLPVNLWEKIADEAGPYAAWLRCTGGGEPMMHPKMTEMIQYAKNKNCRVWLNTNGSLFGPNEKRRKNLSQLIEAKIDIIEFSMDASDPETYQIVRPPLKGSNLNTVLRWENQIDNIKFALNERKRLVSPTRIVVSVIRQKIVENKIDQIVDFWKQLGVDEVITRKFLSWDDNTSIDLTNSADKSLYNNEILNEEPCVWPFERLNVDTLGRIALCGQDISFRTAKMFPNLNDSSIQEIWLGEAFSNYRKKHLAGRGRELFPCTNCSAWKAGVRSWDHGWIKVLDTSGQHLTKVFEEDVGAEVKVHTPKM